MVVRERDVMKWIILVFVLNVTLLLCFTFIDPLLWRRDFVNDDPTNSYGFCEPEGSSWIIFSALLVLVDGSALVLACVMAYRARDLDKEFQESKYIGLACASWFQAIVIGGPVILLTRKQPVAQYFTSSALIFLVCSSMLLLLFIPKMKRVSKQATRSGIAATGTVPGTNNTMSQTSRFGITGAANESNGNSLMRSSGLELKGAVNESNSVIQANNARQMAEIEELKKRILQLESAANEKEQTESGFVDDA